MSGNNVCDVRVEQKLHSHDHSMYLTVNGTSSAYININHVCFWKRNANIKILKLSKKDTYNNTDDKGNDEEIDNDQRIIKKKKRG